MERHKTMLNIVSLNRICLNTVGTCSINNIGQQPEPQVKDAILTEKGGPILLEKGGYIKLEKTEDSQPQPAKKQTFDKSIWDF